MKDRALSGLASFMRMWMRPPADRPRVLAFKMPHRTTPCRNTSHSTHQTPTKAPSSRAPFFLHHARLGRVSPNARAHVSANIHRCARARVSVGVAQCVHIERSRARLQPPPPPHPVNDHGLVLGVQRRVQLDLRVEVHVWDDHGHQLLARPDATVLACGSRARIQQRDAKASKHGQQSSGMRARIRAPPHYLGSVSRHMCG